MVNGLQVEKREVSTKGQLNQLRTNGKVPAVVYGENIENVSIAVSQKELIGILKTNPNAILQVELPEQGNHPVMIGELQRDPITRSILHVDFQQINVKNPIKASVRLDFTGKAEGVESGGILQTRINEIEVLCLPHLIPTSIGVDVSALSIGDTLLVSDLQIPDDIELTNEPSEVVVTILVPQKELEEGEETAEAEITEADSVEVIGEKES